MPLTDEQRQRFRERLLSMKKETEKLLEHGDHFGTEFELIKESMGELSNYDNHPADDGTMLYDREKDIALNEHTESQLDEIEHALERIEQGTYGICEKCGKDIPLERLDAHPIASRCVEHSTDRLVSRKRPIEEDILKPPFGKNEHDEREQTMFDAEDAWQRVASWGTSETPSDFSEQAKFSYNEMDSKSDQANSYVEDVEGFLATDLEDDESEVIPRSVYEAYEEERTNSQLE